MSSGMRTRLLGIAAVVVFGLVGPIAVGTSAIETIESRGDGDGIDREECRMLDEINRFRRQNGLGKLALSRDLTEAAAYHSRDMARRDYFKHRLSDGTDWDKNIRNFGYKGNPIGENIAAGNEKAGPTFEQWRKSDGHRKNMLQRSFGSIGIGRAYDRQSKYDWYWTTTFGGRPGKAISC